MPPREESPRRCAADEVERDVDEHVLLPADHAAPARLLQQRSGVEAIPCARPSRHGAGSWSTPPHSPGSASRGRRGPVAPAAAGPGPRRRLRARADRSRAPSPCRLGRGDEDLQRGIAGARAHARQTRRRRGWRRARTATMELATPSDRLWWAWMPISVVGRSTLAQRVDAVGDVAHQPSRRRSRRRRRTSRRSPPSARPARPARRGAHVAHHQEADGVHAELARGRDMLGGDVGLGAVGGHPHRRSRRPGGPP